MGVEVMTTPTSGKRVFLGAFKPPRDFDEMTAAERHAWALTVADAMIATYRRSKEADGPTDPDADQQVPAPKADGGPADDVEPER
jgi:hypothetical protein